MVILPSYKEFLIYVIKHNGECPPVYRKVEISCRDCYFHYHCCVQLKIKSSRITRKELAIKNLNHYSQSTLKELLFEENL